MRWSDASRRVIFLGVGKRGGKEKKRKKVLEVTVTRKGRADRERLVENCVVSDSFDGESSSPNAYSGLQLIVYRSPQLS